MSILVDTNIILDILLEREPFYKESVMFLKKTQKKRCCGFFISDNNYRFVLYCQKSKR